MQHLQQPLTGFPAFVKFLEIAYAPGAEIWIKAGHNSFFVGEADPSGNFPIALTHGTGTGRKRIKQYPDTFELVSAIARHQNGGVFFIPGKPQGYPLKDYCYQSDLISAEMDNGSIDEQWQRLQEFSTTAGLIPAVIVHSGNRSLHLHIKLDAPVDIPTRTFLARLLALALQSDPAVTNAHQPMRLPGFLRKEKGLEQTLEFYSTETYTVEQVIAGIQLAFAQLGYVYHEQLSDERWRKINNALSPSKKTGDCVDKLRDILAAPEVQPQPKPKYNRRYSDNSSLSTICDIIDYDIYPRLTADMVFGDLDRWSRPGRNCWCPFCTIKEKKPSFSVDDRKHVFNCFGCGAKGTWIHYIQARYNLKIWDAIKLLASWTNVVLPSKPPKTGSSDHTTTEPGRPLLPKLSESELKWLAEYLAWEREQEEVSAAQAEEEKSTWISGLIDKIKKRFEKKTRRLARAGADFNTTAIEQECLLKQLICTPEQVPTPDEWCEIGKPKLIFKSGDRIAIFKAAYQKGWQHILDQSNTGSGKSHDAGLLEPKDFESNKIWFISDAHRNPTTLTVEVNFTDMPVRNDGLITDPNFKTPAGKDYIRWTKKGEIANTGNNCIRTKQFHAFAEKGYEVASNDAAAADNPICLTCPLAYLCSRKLGIGYGYRYARSLVFGNGKDDKGADRIRISPQSLPDPTDYPFGGDSHIWDEATKIIKVVKDFTATLYDLDKMFAEIEGIFPQIHEDLKPLRLALRPLLNDAEMPRHGWNDKEIRDFFPEVPGNVDRIIALLETILPKFEDLLTEHNSITMADNDDKGLSEEERERMKKQFQFARRQMKKEAARDTLKNILDLASNWLIPLLEVWSGKLPGSMRISKIKNEGADGYVRTLTITKRDGYHREIIKSSKFNIFLDATATVEELARLIDVSASEILVIQQEQADFSNKTIKHIIGFGRLGHQRSESLCDRVAIFKNWLRTKHTNDIAIFDFMHYAKKDGDEAWHFGTEARGSNQFQNIGALALFGEPYKNLGVELANYQTTIGRQIDIDSPEFQNYIQQQLQKAVVQEAGRLRAHLRSKQQLTLYAITDSEMAFLKEAFPGAKFEELDVYSLCPEAGSAAQHTRHALLEAFKAASELGEKITQAGLAARAGITQGWISQIAAIFGGWRCLKKILATLYKPLMSSTTSITFIQQAFHAVFIFYNVVGYSYG